jgi:hypothetical protein
VSSCVLLLGHARAVDPPPVESQARSVNGESRAQSAETSPSTDVGAGLQASEFNALLNADAVYSRYSWKITHSIIAAMCIVR